jgi:hypothetical protein
VTYPLEVGPPELGQQHKSEHDPFEPLRVWTQTPALLTLNHFKA